MHRVEQISSLLTVLRSASQLLVSSASTESVWCEKYLINIMKYWCYIVIPNPRLEFNRGCQCEDDDMEQINISTHQVAKHVRAKMMDDALELNLISRYKG